MCVYKVSLRRKLRVAAAPVGVDDEGVVDVQLHGGEDVLLGALVLHVVVEGPGEGDLRVVVDVAAHLQYSTVQYSTVQLPCCSGQAQH